MGFFEYIEGFMKMFEEISARPILPTNPMLLHPNDALDMIWRDAWLGTNRMVSERFTWAKTTYVAWGGDESRVQADIDEIKKTRRRRAMAKRRRLLKKRRGF